MQDVAKAAGVSTATVSRCLNEPDKVSKITRDNVLAVVKRLHYATNFGARAIAANRTGTIGVIIPTMENAIFARGVEAFQKVLDNNRMTMLVANSNYDKQREEQQIRALVARGADGLLLIGTERDQNTYEFLARRSIPTVLAWTKAENPTYSYVGFDNYEAARKIAALAIAKGHKRFGVISAFTEMNDRARARVRGFKQAVKEAGLDPGEMTILQTQYSVKRAREAFEELCKIDKLPSVIFCGNDVLATGALQAAVDKGMRVPDDIAITGFDDIEMARIVRPALTTVHVPHREMGRVSAQALHSLLEGEEGPFRIDLTTHIVERDSL